VLLACKLGDAKLACRNVPTRERKCGESAVNRSDDCTLAQLGQSFGALSSTGRQMKNEDVLQSVILGIPRVAKRIVELPNEQRKKALAAVEQIYLRIATDLDYGESEARDWIRAIMDCLRTEVEERVRREMQVADYDGFVSLEKTLSLLMKARRSPRE
jgi:hypothetical protein